MFRRKCLYGIGACTISGVAGCLSDSSDDSDDQDDPQSSSIDESQIRSDMRIDTLDRECADMIEIVEYDHSVEDDEFVVDGLIRNVADESAFLSDDPVTVSLRIDLENYSGVSDPTEVFIEPGGETEFTLQQRILSGNPPREYELLADPHCEDVKPVILNDKREGDLLPIPIGISEISVEVENQGGTGQVTVTAFIFDEEEDKIDYQTATRTLGSSDVETFSFRSIDDSAEYYEVYATPVCDRPNDENNPYFC